MNTVQRISEELNAKRDALTQLLDTPKDQRGADFAAKRDSLSEEVKGLAADHQAAMLGQASEAEKAQIIAQREKAINQLDLAQKGNPGEARSNNVISLKDFRAGIKSAGAVEVPISLQHGIKAVVDRSDMNPDPSYEELNLKPLKRAQILDFLPSAQTTQTSVTYRRGSVVAAATGRKESQTLAEFSQTASKITDPIEVIGSVMHVSLEEYEDDGQFSLVLSEMANDVLRELDEQVMIGTGTSPALRGITTTASPQTEAYSASRLQTIINATMNLMDTEKANPALYAFKPSDWALIHGDIVAGAWSAVQYIQGGITPVINGIPVVLQSDLTSGVGVVLDPSLYAVIYRQGLVVESTNANGTMFNDLTVSFRAYVRAALKTRRLGCRLIDLTS